MNFVRWPKKSNLCGTISIGSFFLYLLIIIDIVWTKGRLVSLKFRSGNIVVSVREMAHNLAKFFL